MDEEARRLRRIGSIKEIGYKELIRLVWPFKINCGSISGNRRQLLLYIL